MKLTKKAFNGKAPALMGEWITNSCWAILISMLENKALLTSAPAVEAAFKLKAGDIRPDQGQGSAPIKAIIDSETNNGTRLSYALMPTGWIKRGSDKGAYFDMAEYASEKGVRVFLSRDYLASLELEGQTVYQYRPSGPVFNAATIADTWIMLMPLGRTAGDAGDRPLAPYLEGNVDAAQDMANRIEKGA